MSPLRLPWRVPCPNVAYAGAAPYLISGLTQVTVLVPEGVTPGRACR